MNMGTGSVRGMLSSFFNTPKLRPYVLWISGDELLGKGCVNDLTTWTLKSLVDALNKPARTWTFYKSENTTLVLDNSSLVKRKKEVDKDDEVYFSLSDTP